MLEANTTAGACPAPRLHFRWVKRALGQDVPPRGDFWSLLCRDELRDEQLLENMEGDEHGLEGEGGAKPQSKGLVFKIASKRKCSRFQGPRLWRSLLVARSPASARALLLPLGSESS